MISYDFMKCRIAYLISFMFEFIISFISLLYVDVYFALNCTSPFRSLLFFFFFFFFISEHL